ncbi:HipA family kinase [Streptomyces glaucescens]|uniref:HipA family kinase n=1 Tax=Streptomyces glaucescens TaxID=1907 RepID=UPI000A3A85D7|nr:HipA family kinase [Streptomyces glaucescens]
MLKEVTATRYITPLREGGSLPGLVEADDFGTYVIKFRGAGQGRKTLVAEVVCGELARRLGFRTPRLVTVDLDPDLGLGEPDQQVQELLKSSGGTNLGMDFLSGALGFDPLAFPVSPEEAGRIVWFDALVNNVDRSWRNPNLLMWRGAPWLIDHGAALVFHHRWGTTDPAKAYDFRHHALGHYGPDVRAADAELRPKVTEELLRAITAEVPDAWLADEPGFGTPEEVRRAYVEFLHARVRASEAWLPTDFPSRAELAAENARRAAKTQQGRPDWLKRVPDLHGKPAAEQDWSVHLG